MIWFAVGIIAVGGAMHGHRNRGRVFVGMAEGPETVSWTHSICDRCWVAENPGRIPHRALHFNPFSRGLGRAEEICCFCGDKHTSGIYVRRNPDLTPCGGRHE
jgi:hypothetical protein